MRIRCSRLTALAAAVVLAVGCGDTATEVAQEPTRGGPSCDERSVDVPPDSAISWANYLRSGDRVYTARQPADPAPAVGERLGAVTCKRSNSRTPVDHLIQDGEAAYLEVGTEFHAVAGRNPDEAITAVFNGQRLLFTSDPELTAELAEAQRPASDALDIPDGAGAAQVCMAATTVDLPNTNCKQLDEDAAGRLAAAMDGAAPYGVGKPCKGERRIYKIVLGEPATARTFVATTPCGPLTEGTRRYQITDDLAGALIREHDDA